MTHASYSYQIGGQVIASIDHNEGRSVINDVRNVLAELKHACLNLGTYRVIYRDTLGTWEEIRVGPHGDFDGLRNLNAADTGSGFVDVGVSVPVFTPCPTNVP